MLEWYLVVVTKEHRETRAQARGGFGVKNPPWTWYFTKTLLPAQRRLFSQFSHTCCLLICQLNVNTAEWICMQISMNTVNGSKSNNLVLVGIWVIVCIQEPSHYFFQTFRPLRMFKIVCRDSSLHPKQLSLYCLLWLNSSNFAKTFVWKTWIWRHKQRTPNTDDTIRHWMKPTHENFLRTPLPWDTAWRMSCLFSTESRNWRRSPNNVRTANK